MASHEGGIVARLRSEIRERQFILIRVNPSAFQICAGGSAEVVPTTVQLRRARFWERLTCPRRIAQGSYIEGIGGMVTDGSRSLFEFTLDPETHNFLVRRTVLSVYLDLAISSVIRRPILRTPAILVEGVESLATILKGRERRVLQQALVAVGARDIQFQATRYSAPN
jgi:hypothetical protein